MCDRRGLGLSGGSVQGRPFYCAGVVCDEPDDVDICVSRNTIQ